MAVVDRLDQEICDQADDQKSRQNAGLAIEWLRSSIDVTLIERSPVSLLFNGMSKHRPLFAGAFTLPDAGDRYSPRPRQTPSDIRINLRS